MEKISEINGVAPGKLGRSRFYLSYKILISFGARSDPSDPRD